MSTRLKTGHNHENPSFLTDARLCTTRSLSSGHALRQTQACDHISARAWTTQYLQTNLPTQSWHVKTLWRKLNKQI